MLRSGPFRVWPWLAFLGAALAPVAVALPEPMPRVTIIIDDLGYDLAAGRRAIGLPGPVVLAILPGTPRARDLASVANSAGKEVLLHLPLQAEAETGAPEPGEIVLDTTRKEFARSFAASIQSVPFAIGVNSHRGSLLTRHPGHMRWLMEEIGARDKLLFVDSYTTPQSVALRLARENGIPSVRRDVFLDNVRDRQSISREFERLKRLAMLRGQAIGIGHPYPETLELLEQEIPGLPVAGFELVGVSEYVALKGRGSDPELRLSAIAHGLDPVD
jgi:polysaccharide deacetylase 2 family uncharacterized protein YibQ